jgi:hypothetical protein
MFAVFSQIQGVPNIHQIHKSEISAKQALIDIASKCISEKSEKPSQILTLPLDQIKLETFEQYPAYTYLSLDENNIEIYQHIVADKIEKGWVWNGISKTVDSKRIGTFQILPVIDPIVEDDNLIFQMEKMIDHIIDNIEEANEELNKDIEEVKRLQFDIQKHLEYPILFDYSTKIEYPHQPSTIACDTNDKDVREENKTNLIDFQDKYLPSIEEGEGEEEDNLEETKEDTNGTIHRCRSTRRGIQYGRTNYNLRRMRLRAY